MKAEHNSEDLHLSKLETFQSIDVESDWTQVSKRIGFEKNRMPVKRKLTMVWRAAATIIVILGIGYLTQQYVLPFSNMIAIQAGEEVQQVILPDGSKVSLNSNSELIYPEKFKHYNREVLLSGEAFFEVEAIPNAAFLISN